VNPRDSNRPGYYFNPLVLLIFIYFCQEKGVGLMRIVTRPDFDGIVCAVLLNEAENISERTKWVEPSEIQKGQAEIREGDILANLPYHEKCSMWFDHHCTNEIKTPFKGAFKIAPSAAGIIFEYYQGKFRKDFTELVQQTDKIDSANLTLDEVVYPERYPYVMLSMTIHNRNRSDEPYWNNLVELFQKMDFNEVMKHPDVKQYCKNAIERNRVYRNLLQENTRVEEQVSITDFRSLETTPIGNRFLVYSMYPDTVVNVKIRYTDEKKEIIAVSVGQSIFNKNCNVNAGKLLSRFEGGGHKGAGSCRFHVRKADDYIPQIISVLRANEPYDPPD
jgi:oligoribonuclease NrnB/cAMP/cGMP phosphodiesterase (DHH superfamily)